MAQDSRKAPRVRGAGARGQEGGEKGAASHATRTSRELHASCHCRLGSSGTDKQTPLGVLTPRAHCPELSTADLTLIPDNEPHTRAWAWARGEKDKPASGCCVWVEGV